MWGRRELEVVKEGREGTPYPEVIHHVPGDILHVKVLTEQTDPLLNRQVQPSDRLLHQIQRRLRKVLDHVLLGHQPEHVVQRREARDLGFELLAGGEAEEGLEVAECDCCERRG